MKYHSINQKFQVRNKAVQYKFCLFGLVPCILVKLSDILQKAIIFMFQLCYN